MFLRRVERRCKGGVSLVSFEGDGSIRDSLPAAGSDRSGFSSAMVISSEVFSTLLGGPVSALRTLDRDTREGGTLSFSPFARIVISSSRDEWEFQRERLSASSSTAAKKGFVLPMCKKSSLSAHSSARETTDACRQTTQRGWRSGHGCHRDHQLFGIEPQCRDGVLKYPHQHRRQTWAWATNERYASLSFR